MICIWSSWWHCHICFIKIQNGSTILVPAYPGCPGNGPLNGWLSVCLSVCLQLMYYFQDIVSYFPKFKKVTWPEHIPVMVIYRVCANTCQHCTPNMKCLYFTHSKDITRVQTLNKSSAVAEMGDRFATVDMGRRVGGAAVPLSAGESWSPSNTMSPGPSPTSVPSGILIHPTV